MGQRRFGRVNWLGLYTLARREIWRFCTVWLQTILAPVITAALFLLIFDLAIGPRRGDVMGVTFSHFLAPGILMMAVIQNAFANSSSSLIVSKVHGNIVDTLMPPLSPLELVIGYTIGGIARGLGVGLTVAIVVFPIVGLGFAHPLWALVFATLGSAMMALVGVIAAIWANKFDQMSAISNFIVTPLSFLSGTFYTIDALPPVLQAASSVNPFFYLIDGFRYGVIGRSEASPYVGLLFSLVVIFALGLLAWNWFRTGYRLKS